MKHEDMPLIEALHNGTLSPEESNQLLERMKTDEKLKEASDFQLNLLMAVDAAVEGELLNVLQAEEQNIQSAQLDTRKLKPLQWKTYLLIAASVALLIGAGFVFFKPTKPSPSELYAEHFEPFRNVLYPISRGNENETDTEKAFFAYEQQDYAAANKRFAPLLEGKADADVRFYFGISLLAEGDTMQGIEQLNVAKENGTQFKQEARWYLALAHLKVDATEKAKAELKAIIRENEGPLSAKSQALLQALD